MEIMKGSGSLEKIPTDQVFDEFVQVYAACRETIQLIGRELGE